MMSFTCLAQNEPETIRGKDMMDKIDRSEIGSDDIESVIEIDEDIPKIELQKIEFEKPPVKKASVKRNSTKRTSVKRDSKSVVKKQTKSKKASVKKEASNKKKILVSDRSLTLSGLQKDDIIVSVDGSTYVYRKVKSNTVQHLFKGSFSASTKGLKSVGENRYIVESLDFLKTAPTPTPIVAKKVEEGSVDLSDSNKIKKDFEDTFNNGKKITNTIVLKRLKKSDVVFVIGGVQLMVRRNGNTLKKEYYWLTEKFDTNSESVKSLTKNSYKLVKYRYETGK